MLDKSVLIVRTKTGVKAFHNSCRHRGVQFASGHGNCEKTGFVCPFHGWRWNMDGKNTFVYGRHLFTEHQLDQADLALKPCRVETALGSAFINWDDDAPSFRDSIGPLVDLGAPEGAWTAVAALAAANVVAVVEATPLLVIPKGSRVGVRGSCAEGERRLPMNLLAP